MIYDDDDDDDDEGLFSRPNTVMAIYDTLCQGVFIRYQDKYAT